MPKLNQQGVIHLFVPIILLIGLVAGVYLITSGNPLKLFSKASNNPIIFVLPDGSKCNPAPTTCRITTSSATVRVELTSTLGSPVGTPATTARTNVLGVSEQTQTINLSAGWDPIGLTVSKANYKAEDLLVEFNTQLSSSGSRATQIIRWNSGRQEFHTLGQQANNFNIIPGEGYQIRTTKGGRVTISGDQATVSSISVNQGYASFFLPTVPDNIKTAEDLLQEMKKQGIDVSAISRWKDGRWDSHIINFPANNYQIEPGKGYLIRNTGAAKTFNIPALTSTPSPVPSPIPSFSPSATPIVGTRYYKIAENPTDLDSATWQVYDQEPKVVDYTFRDTAPGVKFIWVEFKASDDRIDRRSAQIEIISTTPSPSPIPSSSSYARVFVTSTTYTGNFHGLAGADAQCQARADIKNLGGTWKAWLSDRDTSAASRLNHSNNPYKLLNGVLIANNWEDLTKGAIANPININEMGQIKSTPIWVGAWTSTKSDGSYRLDPFGSQSDCNKWTMNTSSYNGYALGAFTGTNTATNNTWTEGSTETCNTQQSLYCFEQ